MVDLAQVAAHAHRAADAQAASAMDKVEAVQEASVKALVQVDLAQVAAHVLVVDLAHRADPLRVDKTHLLRSVRVEDVVHHQQ